MSAEKAKRPSFNDPIVTTTLDDDKPQATVVSTTLPSSSETRPFTIMSENDAYIAERMKQQPKSITDIEFIEHEEDKVGIHRLSLPEYFEEMSYDCTRGHTCGFHAWRKHEVFYGIEVKMDRWEQTKRGKYIFRWLNKNKRALDQSLNVKGWYLANRSFFQNAPKILLSANGGIENGDSILGFMPVEKAISLRTKPSKDSLDRVRSEETK